MIQKKICMVGTFGVGKTSLVERYVHSRFEDKYLTTLGVKITKKPLDIAGQEVNLMLWDLAGKDKLTTVSPMNLRGASGYLLVADGTRAHTLDALFDLQTLVQAEVGEVPFTCVINKVDLREQWEVNDASLARLDELGWKHLLTSAKSGEAVEELFLGLAERMLEDTESDGESDG
jgi:small GTP-binding protein